MTNALATLKSPIVLVHGLLGFDRIQIAGCTLASYFPGVAERLRAAGNRVFVAALSPTAAVEHRARELLAFLDLVSPTEPVHLFAHSMGGLDARYLISRLGRADRVLTLTTLGTPHRGTAFADWGIRMMEWALRPTLHFLQLPYQAFYDLTSARCRQFNLETLDHPGVRYFSIAAEHDGRFSAPEWLLPYRVVKEAEGPNDGVVSVASARYGEHCDIWPGDHMSLVNWLFARGADPMPRWAELIGRLRDLGY